MNAPAKQIVRAMVNGSVVRTIGPLSPEYARDVARHLVERGYWVEREDVPTSKAVTR